MKIRITFDISDDTRVAISASQGKGFKPASREDLEEFITDIVSDRLTKVSVTYEEAMGEILERLRRA